MPSELFGAVSQPAPQARTRSRTVVTISVAAHAAVLTGVLFFSVSSDGLLPAPRQVLAYALPEFMRVDIELPVEPRPAPTPASSPGHTDAARPTLEPDENVAPVVAPPIISAETGAETAPPRPNRSGLDRVESGTALEDGLRVGRIERPAAPPVVQTPVRLHSGIRSPVKVVHVDPAYPPMAQRARVEGVVILEAVIGTSGRVESVEVLRSIPLLDQSAVSAVRQWQYRPAMLNDEAVPVIVTVTVHFKL